MPHIVYMYESCLYNVISEINIKSKKKKKKKKKKNTGVSKGINYLFRFSI